MAAYRKSSRFLLALSLGTALVTGATVPATAQERVAARDYDIPAQALGSAIIAFSRQSDTVVTAPADLVRGKRASAVRGNFSKVDALQRLLAGTGLTYRAAAGGGFVLEAPRAPVQTSENGDESVEEGEPNDLITVTGTRIRGAQPSSPVVTVTREEMKRRGQNTLGEAIRALPQNFAGGQNPEVGFISTNGGVENQNNTGGSALNLRGLGPSSTLTLLNGARLPFDGIFQATDVSPFPAAAVERIEVLLDGASAIYGADAIGGVANIVLRRDYDGAELSARYGMSTRGGYEQQEYTAVLGTTWADGGFIATGNYTWNEAVSAEERDYTAALPDRSFSIVPELLQRGGVFSGHHSFGAVTLALDAFYSQRDQDLIYVSNFRYVDHRETDSWGVLPSLTLDTAFGWTAKLSGFLGSNNTFTDQQAFDPATGVLVPGSSTLACYCNRARSATLEAEGPVFALPGGDLRVAAGIGYRYNRLNIRDYLGTGYNIDESRSSKYAFGEVSAPLIGPDNNVPFISRLTVNGALRYEDYSDFGSITTPKVGAVLSPVEGFDLRASWGRSFKTPNLNDQYFPVLSVYYPTFFANYAGVPAGNLLVVQGGNPNLSAERAETITAGLRIAPPEIPGLQAELNWYRIDYRERVVNPILTGGLTIFTSPAYAEYAIINPTVAQLNAAFAAGGLAVGDITINLAGPYDPSTVTGLLLAFYTNAAQQIATGMDASVSYGFDLGGGQLNIDVSGSWLDGFSRFNELTESLPTTGRTYFPADFKARAGVSWTGGGFIGALNLNHVGSVQNFHIPSEKVGPFQTVDLVIGYTAEDGPIGAFEVRLAVTNLFDSDPPLFTSPFPGLPPYDPTNYSSIGRVANLTVTKRF